MKLSAKFTEGRTNVFIEKLAPFKIWFCKMQEWLTQDNSSDVAKCLQRIEIPDLLHMCATCSKQPSNISYITSITFVQVICSYKKYKEPQNKYRDNFWKYEENSPENLRSSISTIIS